jgi:hypothetical protein
VEETAVSFSRREGLMSEDHQSSAAGYLHQLLKVAGYYVLVNNGCSVILITNIQIVF